VSDADAEDAFLVIAEDDFGEGFKRDGHVDAADELAIEFGVGEDVVGGLFEDVFTGGSDPGGVDGEFAGGCATLCGDDAIVTDGAVFGAVFRFDGVGVIPEVEVVGVAVVEPEAGMVRVIDALAGNGLEGIAAGDGGAVGRDERIEDGLALVGVPEVGGEGLAVDGDIDAVGGFAGDDLDSFAVFGVGSEGEGAEREECWKNCAE
jgi:hypothetical protein